MREVVNIEVLATGHMEHRLSGERLREWNFKQPFNTNLRCYRGFGVAIPSLWIFEEGQKISMPGEFSNLSIEVNGMTSDGRT